MTIVATCATIALALMSAKGGETINLKGDCPQTTIRAKPARIVTVNAGGATVRGLWFVNAANIRWRSGTIRAPKGALASSGDGYGALVRGSTNIRFDGVLFTDAKKALVTDDTDRVTIADSRFLRYGEDGIIANRTRGLTVVRNRFGEIVGKPTECTVAGGVLPGLAKRDCDAQGGAWIDGFHADAVQMRNATTDVLIADNVVAGLTQGLTQMDTTGDAPLQRVRIVGNTVTADAHHISLGSNCEGCAIERNTVRRWSTSSYRAVIRPGAARRCGNDVQDEKSDGGCSQ